MKPTLMLGVRSIGFKYIDKNLVFKTFRQYLMTDTNMAAAVGAVGALTEVIKASKANTMMELEKELKAASDILKDSSNALSVASGCELFTRFVIRTSGDYPVRPLLIRLD
jgi:hypothetical protein